MHSTCAKNKNNPLHNHHAKITSKKINTGTALMVQWLRFHASNAGCMGSIPGQGSSTCHVTKKYKINNRVNKFDIKKKKINTNSQISTTQSYSGFPNCPPSFFIVIFFKHSIMAHTFPLSIIASLVSFAFRISTRFVSRHQHAGESYPQMLISTLPSPSLSAADSQQLSYFCASSSAYS